MNYEIPSTKAIPEKSFIGSSEGYYVVDVECRNCGFTGRVYVQKRLSLWWAFCPICECNKSLELKICPKETKKKTKISSS